MGILSDPSLTRNNKLGRTLAKHNRKICILFYIAGLVWFVCLADINFNHGTYLSENALSPGLVYPEIKHDSSRFAQSMMEELKREQSEHKSTTPLAWIAAKMQQIGLETHVHNFTLNYPFGGSAHGPESYKGKNVYGILRAPRSGSTEGVVFCAPYRAVNSIHVDISASVPVLLAFADFARRKNYWAKDLIFLVTEQEQLGMEAWLEAYYQDKLEDSYVLQSGNLPARAGALQAAVNLEIQDLDFDYVNVKLEGLNGQLPNLDMFNLVQRITAREGISSGYKNNPRRKRRASNSPLEDNLKRMLSMILSQATGVPNGNHGLFHRYRVESLTLEAVRRSTHSSQANKNNIALLSLLKTIEGISRSLNNLLERFHQSYFFYILVANDRFVSIGDYMPCLIGMAAPLFIKAFLLWLKENDDEQQQNQSSTKSRPYKSVLMYISLVWFICFVAARLPVLQIFRQFATQNAIGTPLIISSIILASLVILSILALMVRFPEGGLELLHICALILMGTALMVIGLLNFSLGFLVAVVTTPLAIILTTSHLQKALKVLIIPYTIIINPLIAVGIVVSIYTLYQFPELELKQLALRSWAATKDTLAYTYIDSIIYGNWLFTIFVCVFMPIWCLFLTVAVNRRTITSQKKLKQQ